jgi:predicted PurR-regulated permease PerM
MTSEPTAPRQEEVESLLDAGGGDLVPGWLRRLGAIGWRVLVIAVIGVVLVTVAVNLSTVTGSILFASVIAAAVAPMYTNMRDARGWSHTKAAAAASLVALGLVVLIVVLIAWAFVPYVVTLVRAASEGFTDIEDLLRAAGVPDAAIFLVDRAAQEFQDWLADAVAQFVGPVANIVTIFILGGFLTFYLLQDGAKAWRLALRDLDDWREAALTSRAEEALARVGGYLRATTTNAAIDAATAWVILTIVGVPFAGPLAVLVFIAGFVPYIGSIFATIVITLVTLATTGLWQAALMLVLLVVSRLVERQVLARYVYGATTLVHPALVVVALPAGAALFGLTGLIAAVPVALVVATFVPALVRTLEPLRDPGPAPGLVPTWLDRLAQWSWRGLVVFGMVLLGIQLAVAVPGVIVPIVLALVLAATLQPGVEALVARGLSRGQSALVVTVSSMLAVGAAIAVAVIAIGGSSGSIIQQAAIGAAEIAPSADDIVRTLGSGLVTNVTVIFGALAALIIAVLLGTMLTFYFLRDGGSLWDRILELVGHRRRENLAAAGTQAAGILNGYMVGTSIISLFAAVTQWLIMVLLGLPLAFPIGVLTFFGNFIPYIGGAVTTLLGFLVAVAVGSTTDIVLMAIYTLVFNIVQGNFVAPLVYGRTVSLHPAIVLLAIPAGGQVAGIIGMFLVVPFLGVVATTWRLVLHLFDPDSTVPTESDARPVLEASAPARAPGAAAPGSPVESPTP